MYEISTNNHSLPVYLQYDASGVRVAQQASWVGLGWSIVAGGVITRMIRGLDDFDNSGFNSIGALPPIDAENQPHYQEMYSGRLDNNPAPGGFPNVFGNMLVGVNPGLTVWLPEGPTWAGLGKREVRFGKDGVEAGKRRGWTIVNKHYTTTPHYSPGTVRFYKTGKPYSFSEK